MLAGVSKIAGGRGPRPGAGLGHQAVWAAATAWVTHVSSLAVGVVLTPLLIRELGASGYGTWGVCLGVVGYLGLLDLGVGTAVAVNGARLVGAGNAGAVAPIFAAARRFYWTVATAAVACGGGLAWWASRAFHGSAWVGEVTDVCLILAVAQGIILLSAPFGSMAAALGRPYVPNVGRTIGILVYGAGGAGALISGAGVRGVALSWALGNALACTYIVHGARRLMPAQLRSGSYSLEMPSLLREGLPYLVNSLAWQLVFATDSIVIAATLGTEAVARYLPTFRFVEAIGHASLLPLSGLLPLMGAVGGSGDRSRLAFLLRRSTTLSLAFTLVGASLALGLGSPIITLWVGADFYAGAGVLVSLVCFMVARAVSASSANVLASTGDMRRVAVATVGEGLLNLILSLTLVGPLGITGVALATMIAHLAVSGWILPLGASSATDTRPRQWLYPALERGFKAAIPAILTVAALRWAWSDARAAFLLVRLAVFGLIAIAGLWALALDRDERETVWRALRLNIRGG